MKTKTAIKILFTTAAIYEGILGVAFLFAGNTLFSNFNVPPPNHPGYIQFPAALLITFALMFVAIARNPARNLNLIPYGILLKLSYCSVITFHWFNAGIPNMWKPFCIFDFIFLLLFAYAWKQTQNLEPNNATKT